MPLREAWKIRAITWHVTITVAAIFATLCVVYALRSVLLLLAFTVIFCYLVLPLVDLFEAPGRRWGWKIALPRTASILLVYLLLFAVVAISLERLIPVVSDQVTSFLDNLPFYARKFDQTVKWLSGLPARYRLPLVWRDSLIAMINGIPLRLLEWLQSIASRTIEIGLYLPWLVLIPIIGFFFLKDAPEFQDRLLASFSEEEMRHRATLFLKDVSQTLASYIRAQVIACLLVGTIEGTGLWLMGISFPTIFAIAAGLLEFIPVIGPFILLVLAFIIAAFISWKFAAAVATFLLIFRVIHDYIIYPRLVSDGMKTHPVVIILSVLCGAELSGAVGVFLGVPIGALLLVCRRHWRDLSHERARERARAVERVEGE